MHSKLITIAAMRNGGGRAVALRTMMSWLRTYSSGWESGSVAM